MLLRRRSRWSQKGHGLPQHPLEELTAVLVVVGEGEGERARDLEADAGPHEGGGELQDGDLGVTGADSHEEAKSPGCLKGDSGGRGLVEVTLTGAQLVDYLKVLEQDISGGPGAKRSVEVLSRRMYEAIAPVVDRIEKGKPPAGVPQAVVDDAVVPTPPAASPS